MRPDSQSRCSVIAPMLCIWMNVLVSMIDTITGFRLNLNNQFIDDIILKILG